MVLAWLLACSETGVSPVSAENRGPTISFESPSSFNEELPACRDLFLAAIVYDGDDPDAVLDVSMSLDGVVGGELTRQGSLWTLPVEAGALTPESKHTLVATARDPEGNVASESTQFRVAADAPPDPWILSPANEDYEVEVNPIEVIVDVADEKLDGVRLAWRLDDRDIDGPRGVDAIGRVHFTYEVDTRRDPFHTLEVDATDDCGVTVTAASTFSFGCDLAWYADADGDGYGDADRPVEACEPPAGYVADATDCDDTDASRWRCPGFDDGSICPTLVGTDDGKVPSYPGWCDTSLGFVEDAGHCYFAVTDRTTGWEDARASCMAAGGYLATAITRDESDFLYDIAGRAFAGACDADSEGSFAWISGEPWSFEDFAPGEPNDMSPGEDCFEITGRGAESWNDIWCGYVSYQQAYACEFE